MAGGGVGGGVSRTDLEPLVDALAAAIRNLPVDETGDPITDTTANALKTLTVDDNGAAIDTGKAYPAADALGPVVRPILPLTAFGELQVAERTPQVQVKFSYNLNPDVIQSLTNNVSSTTGVSAGLASVTCAGTANAFSQIRSTQVVRYGPGTGTVFLGTCEFTTGVALSSQVVGPGDDDEGFYFGYDGISFGVLHRSFGQLEERELPITSGADGDGGDFVITLDGSAVTVTVGANATISEVCAAIVAKTADFGNAGRGWEVHTDDNVAVEFISFVAENALGTFSFADVDSGVTADAFETELLGVAPTEVWIAQANWNIDKLSPAVDGVPDEGNSTGFTLDPTKENIFYMQYQYLGAGAVIWGVEDSATGRLNPVHMLKYAGTATIPLLANPTLNLNLIAKTETGYSGPALVMKTSSLAGFIEGKENGSSPAHSVKGTKAATGTTPVNVLLLYNSHIYQGTRNKITAVPFHLSVASEANAGKTVTITLIKRPTQVDGTVSLAFVDEDVTPMKFDTAGTTIVGGQEIFETTLVGSSSKDLNIEHLELEMRPGDRWVFEATMLGAGTPNITVSMTWKDKL